MTKFVGLYFDSCRHLGQIGYVTRDTSGAPASSEAMGTSCALAAKSAKRTTTLALSSHFFSSCQSFPRVRVRRSLVRLRSLYAGEKKKKKDPILRDTQFSTALAIKKNQKTKQRLP